MCGSSVAKVTEYPELDSMGHDLEVLSKLYNLYEEFVGFYGRLQMQQWAVGIPCESFPETVALHPNASVNAIILCFGVGNRLGGLHNSGGCHAGRAHLAPSGVASVARLR